MEAIKRAIKLSDFLSPNVEFYLDGNSRVKTKLGGILCILLLIIAGVGFGWFINRVLTYSDYIVSSNKNYQKFLDKFRK